MVFQEFGLLPWRTVQANVELGLELKGMSAEARRKVSEPLIEMIGLSGFEGHFPHELSGGMKQRVGLARALATDPNVLLMDEPFAALDALTRERLQEDLRQVSADSGRTSVFVTHSVDEAVFLGSRIIVLSKRPGQIALDLKIDLPRTGVDPDDLRTLPAYAAARAEVAHAVRAAAA